MADTEQRERERAAKFQGRVLSEINIYWADQPFIVLFSLFELVGAISSAMVRHDGARVEWIVGMIDALKARVLRDAAVSIPPSSEHKH
jgi:hypothetical protein